MCWVERKSQHFFAISGSIEFVCSKKKRTFQKVPLSYVIFRQCHSINSNIAIHFHPSTRIENLSATVHSNHACKINKKLILNLVTFQEALGVSESCHPSEYQTFFDTTHSILSSVFKLHKTKITIPSL